MKTINSITLILSLQTLLFIISIPSSHARTFHPKDGTLITFTCSHTPYPTLCLQSFGSFLGSDRSDMWGLAGIMLHHILADTTDKALDKTDLLLDESGDRPGQGLVSCINKYFRILDTDIPRAKEAFYIEDPKVPEDVANTAVKEASTCETGYPGYLTQENIKLQHVAANTAAIFKLLHSR
ncbi:unnamed protein product [Lupinus luteus]|uniref:Pectinesterase inhibitor domain-containing protein n=1 Tax=Lupinus luteus TaxID=3873 RepID=A0AAV1Y8B7_LUPLU